MSEAGPGADSAGSTWDNPSWSSSRSDSSLSDRSDDQPPNPWSRQASQPEAPPVASPAPAPPVQPGYDPQPTPPYGSGNPYGDPAVAYGPTPPMYGSNPYEVSPYQPAYGMAGPYGVLPVSHPQSSTALVFGILGLVLAFSCIVGGFLGIAGIVQGRKARNEIDAQPGRYGGRSQAVAGIVTGTIGVVFAVLFTGFLVVAIVAGVLTEGA